MTSCDHCVLSRMNTRSSFSTNSRRVVPSTDSIRSRNGRPVRNLAREFAPSCAML